MAQGTGYTYSQRGDVVLATRTGTTRNQPSNYKPFKLLKVVDTVITFFIKDVDGCPVQLHDKALKARMTKKDGTTVLLNKNLKITDYENGIATLHIQPGDIAGLDLAFYNILLTYASDDNIITAMHADQNYRYCYVAEIVTCGSDVPGEEEVLLFDDAIIPTGGVPISPLTVPTTGSGDWFLYSSIAMTANLEFNLLFGISFRGGLSLSTSSLTSGVITGCHASVNVTINVNLGIYVVAFVNIGFGYQINDQIVIQGVHLGGISGVSYGTGNDLVITVTGVDSNGGITNYTVSGTPYLFTNTYVSRRFPGTAFQSLCSGLQTFSIHSRSGVQGTLNMQVTLNQEPGENDWFDVKFPPCGMKNDIPLGSPTSTTTPVTEAHAIDGMFLYVRFKMTINIGRVDKILYRR